MKLATPVVIAKRNYVLISVCTALYHVPEIDGTKGESAERGGERISGEMGERTIKMVGARANAKF